MPPKLKFSKTEIIDTGFNLVRQNGWQGFTARRLGKALGASSRPVYSFFSSMNHLEEEIVRKGVELLHTRMRQTTTGEPWIDHGIGYVMFAYVESKLFRCINDERHIHLFKKYGDAIWQALTDSLIDYSPFQGLTADQIHRIQSTRWLFAHGLAFQVSNPPPGIWTEKNIVETMRSGSRAIYDGLIKQFGSKEA